VKDLVEFQGHVTTAGCAVWRERVSQYSATLVQKLLAAGMIVLGKTHTVEFAYGAWGTNQHMGTPWNPWDMKTHARRAALRPVRPWRWRRAWRLAPSAPTPAVRCVFRVLVRHHGIEDSIGRISTHGVLPLSPTLDTPGPLARSVEDCAMLLCCCKAMIRSTR
jgi:aspartyl-tRNA(Asn)/glutamyl-tRNA(Gln) amidotransferase subunit A